MNDTPFTVPVFPQNDRASQAWSRIQPKLERLHEEFLGAWRQSLSAIIPANIAMDFQGVECKPYAQFVKDAAAFSDIHVYEVEALQSLCAWSIDPGFVGAAVDHIFGGTGRAHLVDLPPRRGISPIEEGVRRRMIEALATAYESVWQASHPIRLNAFRQEALLSSLRLTGGAEQVVHGRFSANMAGQDFPFELCLPLRALEVLDSEAGSAATSSSPSLLSGPHPSSPNEIGAALGSSGSLEDAQVSIEAVMGDMDLTVAQLMALSIGQVLPLRMNDEVALEVDGLCIATGQSGICGGRHAVKVNVSAKSKWPASLAAFEPLSNALNPEPAKVSEPETSAPPSEAATLVPTDPSSTTDLHEPQQPQ